MTTEQIPEEEPVELTTPEVVDVEIMEEFDEPSTEIALRETRTPSRIEGGMAHFEQYMLLADRICKTAMVPSALRNRPDEVLAVVMYGAELGIGPMQALQQINFIEGKPSMAPELMRALIREAGHKLDITQSKTRCLIIGERGDTGETGEAEFTLDDAVLAGLCTVDVNGIVRARSSSGKALPWEKYTKDMLLARATSRIARLMFSDVISGMSYTPEEVESFVEREPATKAKGATKKGARKSATTTRRAPVVDEPDLATPEEFTTLKTAFGMLEEQDRDVVTGRWEKIGLSKFTDRWTSQNVQIAIDVIHDVLNGVPVESDSERHEDESGRSEGNLDTSQGTMKPASEIKGPEITKAQIGKIRLMVGNAGVDTGDVHTVASDIVHRQIASLKDLTKAEASKIIDQLIADAPAQ